MDLNSFVNTTNSNNELLKCMVSNFKMTYIDLKEPSLDYGVITKFSIKLPMPDGTNQTMVEQAELLISFQGSIEEENIIMLNLNSIKRLLPSSFDLLALKNELIKFCRKDYILRHI